MKAQHLFTYTAVIEFLTGLLFIAIPTKIAALFFGFPMTEVTGITICRIAGAALIVLAYLCWQFRGDAAGQGSMSLVKGLLMYNVIVMVILI
jgi:hypothetical protein